MESFGSVLDTKKIRIKRGGGGRPFTPKTMETTKDFILTPDQPQAKGFFDIRERLEEIEPKRDRIKEMKKAARIRKIIGRIENRIIDLQVLKGGFIMTNKAFRAVLKEHPEMKAELDILESRKFCLTRELWRVA